ncbi:MAG: hypothetical protein ABS43_03570 [Bordetella sp. SCN 67-23]|nr:hypothetical protein [Burkholderiales bacterium]ODS75881.1 MAG: hypothetical protein ABS43_03570 [Bordetella sp. SCN 67-23]OJW91757.1 MAG: hypothetical protein BGO71_21600 [Burkholderiales bacterium 67-32]
MTAQSLAALFNKPRLKSFDGVDLKLYKIGLEQFDAAIEAAQYLGPTTLNSADLVSLFREGGPVRKAALTVIGGCVSLGDDPAGSRLGAEGAAFMPITTLVAIALAILEDNLDFFTQIQPTLQKLMMGSPTGFSSFSSSSAPATSLSESDITPLPNSEAISAP